MNEPRDLCVKLTDDDSSGRWWGRKATEGQGKRGGRATNGDKALELYYYMDFGLYREVIALPIL